MQNGNLIAIQTQRVKDTITFAFVGLETITGILLIILLAFFTVEQNLAQKQAEIKMRREGAINHVADSLDQD
jgi:GPH family glycoside/pentoside/hexuronide:cation symporter